MVLANIGDYTNYSGMYLGARGLYNAGNSTFVGPTNHQGGIILGSVLRTTWPSGGTEDLYIAASSTLLRLGTTTDSLTEGVTNLFYTQARVWTDVWASTSLATILNNASASQFGTTSADYWIGTKGKGYFFSTTSADYWVSIKGYLTNLLGGLNAILGNSTTTNATTTSLAVTGLATPAGTFLAVNEDGTVIATTTPSSTGINDWQIKNNGLTPTTTIGVYLPSTLGIGGTDANSIIYASNTFNSPGFTNVLGIENIANLNGSVNAGFFSSYNLITSSSSESQIGLTGTENVLYRYGSGNITDYTSFFSAVQNYGSGPIDEYRGLWIASSTGNVTKSYDIYADGPYSFNYFAGKVGIGTTTPDTSLNVYGTTTTRNLVVDDGGTGTTTQTLGEVGRPTCLKIRDTDDAGWTYVYALNGALTVSTVSCE